MPPPASQSNVNLTRLANGLARDNIRQNLENGATTVLGDLEQIVLLAVLRLGAEA
jgi:hypothetical protein